MEKEDNKNRFPKSNKISDNELLSMLENKDSLELDKYLDFLSSCLKNRSFKIAEDFLGNTKIKANNNTEDIDFVIWVKVFWKIGILINLYKDKMITQKCIDFLTSLIDNIVSVYEENTDKELNYNLRFENMDQERLNKHINTLKEQFKLLSENSFN